MPTTLEVAMIVMVIHPARDHRCGGSFSHRKKAPVCAGAENSQAKDAGCRDAASDEATQRVWGSFRGVRAARPVLCCCWPLSLEAEWENSHAAQWPPVLGG